MNRVSLALLLALLGATALSAAPQQENAAAKVAYLAYHLPRDRKLATAAPLGLATVEPFTALILNHPNHALRSEAWDAFRTLAQTPSVKADPLFHQALILIMAKAPDYSIRLSALKSVKLLLPKALWIPACQVASEHGSGPIRAASAQALASIQPRPKAKSKPQETRPQWLNPSHVLSGARSPFRYLRSDAAGQAGAVWNDVIRRAVFLLLRDPDAGIQRAAATALAKQADQDPDIVQSVSSLLAETATVEDQLAGLAVLQQRQRGKAKSLQPTWDHVRRLAKSPDDRIRLAVARIASQQGRGKEEATLAPLRKDPNRAVAREALSR